MLYSMVRAVTRVECVEQVIWTPLEPKPQQPFKLSPLERFGHAAEYSNVCSLGYSIEEGVLQGRIVLETLLVRRATLLFRHRAFMHSAKLAPLTARKHAHATRTSHAHARW